jgi:urease accessory protein
MGLFLFSSAAFSHTTETGGFVSGLLHPILGLDHLAAMVAVGILGAIWGAPAIWLLPVSFPMVMACGAVVALSYANFPAVELIVSVSAIVLGAIIISYRKFALWLCLFLVVVFAFFHGYAHGRELPKSYSPTDYCIGFVLTTGSLHVCGILLGLADKSPWGRKFLGLCGGAIAGIGVYFLMA